MENAQEPLANLERQIIEYKQHVAEQEAKIVELLATGPPPEDAVDVLTQFKEMLRIANAQRDHILRKLHDETG